MNEEQSVLIDVRHLRIGMFIDLRLGWMSHPFPSGSFKVTSEKQIEIIRELGLTQVCYIPSRSDLAQQVMEPPGPALTVGQSVPPLESESGSGGKESEALLQRHQREWLALQQQQLVACERRFSEALLQYKKVLEQLDASPQVATRQCVGLVNRFVEEILGQGESAIRLLSEGVGETAHLHPVNVTVLSLLLGKAMGVSEAEMRELGVAAFLHDIGKAQLPERVRWRDENFSVAESKLYQSHVELGVALGGRMALPQGVLQAMAQHHELIDGSGFPARLKADRLSMAAKILALVNQYESLCNPGRPALAVTPHDALSLIFAQMKSQFDPGVLSAFIRMMGVYPPGSVVQLVDGRFALVVSVNSSRPLKPRVLVHEPSVPRHEALIQDLEQLPGLGIRRSIKPVNLPWPAADYLSPRKRICYFFESVVLPVTAEGAL